MAGLYTGLSARPGSMDHGLTDITHDAFDLGSGSSKNPAQPL